MDEKKEPIKVGIHDVRLVAEEVEGGVQVRTYRGEQRLFSVSRVFPSAESAEGACYETQVRQVFEKIAARERMDRDVITTHDGRRALMVGTTAHRVRLRYLGNGQTYSWPTDVSEWMHSQDCHPALLDYHKRNYVLEPGEYRNEAGNVEILDENEFLSALSCVNVCTFHLCRRGAQILQNLTDGRWGDVVPVERIMANAAEDQGSGHPHGVANGWARVLAAHKAKYPGEHS